MSDTLRISGKRFPLPATDSGWKFERRPGGWILATHSSGARLRLAATEARGKFSFGIATDACATNGYGEILAQARGSAGASSQASIDADLTAQFPGKVRKILAKEGASVAAGESLILVEAMKMEFAVKAPVAGKVTKIRVTEGQQLSPGDRFVDFEPVKEGAKNG